MELLRLMPLLKVRRKLEKREKEKIKSRLGAVVKVIKTFLLENED